MSKVIKRDGSIVDFDITKISDAITLAFKSSHTNIIQGLIDLLSIRVTSVAQKFINEDKIFVEDIQDSVEKVLMESGYTDVAKEYITYRRQHQRLRNAKNTMIDYKNIINKYVDVDDWRVKENSTVSYSVGGLILSNSGAITANYWLSEVYDKAIEDAHKNCDIHIHDLSMLSPYCAGWSLKQLIKEGLGGVPGKITSKPAKHLNTLCNQMVNFLGILQNEWAGAQAFSSFDTYLSAFVKADNLTYAETKQAISSFIFGVNTPSRWGCVDTETEVLSVDGFKKYNELHEGDLIYTWNHGKLELNSVRKVVIKPFKGNLHSYRNGKYDQTVTPNHRMLVYEHNTNNDVIKLSEDIFNANTPYKLPVKFSGSDIPGIDISLYEIMLSAIVYTDGSYDIRNGNVHKLTIFKSPNRIGNEGIKNILDSLNIPYTVSSVEGGFNSTVNKYTIYGDAARYVYNLTGPKSKINKTFLWMNMEQAEIFLKVWSSFDGNFDKFMMQCDNNDIADSIQQIALIAGYTSYRVYKNNTMYVKIRMANAISPSERYEIPYNGYVWCPNVENGTAVFRKNGNVYISGQTQAPFSNITLDWTVPIDLKYQNAIVGGKEQNFTYGDCQKEMDMVNKAFIEIMVEGDADGRGFQYPIPTYSITKDFDWSDKENNRLLFEMAAKYGTPYFSNYVNSDMNPSDVRSMCCRLRLDLRELRKKSGGFFGSGESTGSVGVVTINMPRLAYKSSTEKEFFNNLDDLMDIAARSLNIKRKFVTKLYENDFYPYTKRYLGETKFDNHFSTIGLVGMNEACLNAKWISNNISTKEGKEFSERVLNHMRERLVIYQEKYGSLYNLEATPAESTSYRFAMHDREKYPLIITANGYDDNGNEIGDPFYTNSSHLPVNYTEDIFSALDHQDDMQTLYTSGTVFHAFLGERINDWKTTAELVKTIAENYKLPYYTISPTYSLCKEHGYINGEVYECPICHKKTEVYSRITGYYRPVQLWNDGKVSEFNHRKEYKVESNTYDKEDIQNKDIKEDTKVKEEPSTLYLLTSFTCPNCMVVKNYMDNYNIKYELINPNSDIFIDLITKYNITTVPTIIDKENIVRGLPDILEYLK